MDNTNIYKYKFKPKIKRGPGRPRKIHVPIFNDYLQILNIGIIDITLKIELAKNQNLSINDIYRHNFYNKRKNSFIYKAKAFLSLESDLKNIDLIILKSYEFCDISYSVNKNLQNFLNF
jgi:hypothetical protein